MSVQTQRMREERANLHARQQEILDAAGEAGLTAEQSTEFDRIHEQQERLAADIRRIETHEAVGAELSASQGVVVGQRDRTGEQRGAEAGERPSQEAVNDAFNSWLRFGTHGLSAEQRGIMEARHGALGPEARALAAGTPSAGGYTVPEGFYATMVEAMLNFGGVRRAGVTVIPTESGSALPIPTDNDTSNKGARLSENTQVGTQDVTFGSATLNAYMYTSKLVLVSFQLLQDTAFDLNSYLGRKLGTRIGRITNQEFTTGTGSSQPEGIVTGATLGVTCASAVEFTWDELTDLEHSVDPDYRQTSKFMLSDSALKFAKKIKDGEGRPLWQPAVIAGQADRLNGYEFVVNQDMAAVATGTKPILFGAMENYFVRDVSGAQILRLTERYADFLQVGFIAFSRHDGQLVDAGTNPIKYLQLA